MNKKIFITAFQVMPNEGSENHVAFYILNTLLKNKYDVYLYTPLVNRDAINKYFSNDNPYNLYFVDVSYSGLLKIFTPNPLRYSQYISNILWQLNVRKYLLNNTFNYDLYYHINPSSWWAYNGMINNSTPVLVGPLGGYRFPRKGLWHYLNIKSIIFELIRLFILKSPYALYNKNKISKSSSHVIIDGEVNIFNNPNYLNLSHTLSGVDTHLKRIKPTVPKVILAGRFVDIKGHAISLKCLKDINKDFVIEIYGKGPEEDRIVRLISKYNLQSKTVIKGFVETRKEIHNSMLTSNVFIAPYIRENASLMVSEALYSGLPVVTISGTGPASVCRYFNPELSKIAEGTGDILINNIKKNIEFYLDNFITLEPKPLSNFGEDIVNKIEDIIH